jgi:hypothetical protein
VPINVAIHNLLLDIVSIYILLSRNFDLITVSSLLPCMYSSSCGTLLPMLRYSHFFSAPIAFSNHVRSDRTTDVSTCRSGIFQYFRRSCSILLLSHLPILVLFVEPDRPDGGLPDVHQHGSVDLLFQCRQQLAADTLPRCAART